MERLCRCLLALVTLGYWFCTPVPVRPQGRPEASAGDSDLSLAICPIVYPLDQSPSERGFHYLFYGNGFFINDQGYLLTAAHVLSQLNDVQPYVVLRLPMAPPRLLPAAVVGVDRDHDVAILKATPNPFAGKYQVRYLRLALQRPPAGQAVLAAAVRPSRLKDPHTFDAFNEDRPAGQVLDYEFSELDNARGDTQLLLFNHAVLLGDSGAPLVSAQRQAVVGLIEGRWLRVGAAALAAATDQPNSGVGAAIPTHYALALLQQNGVAWHSIDEGSAERRPIDAPEMTLLPAPLSLVAAPHPSLALQGGEVVLDARVNPDGQLDDIKTVKGVPPFLEKVMSAVHTWKFVPTQSKEELRETRIGIVFQFASPAAGPTKNPLRHYDVTATSGETRAALPVVTEESEIFATAHAQPTLIFSAEVKSSGELTSVRALQDSDGLAPVAIPVLQKWQFVPAVRGGAKYDSMVIVVIIPRYGAAPLHVQAGTRAHTQPQ